MTVLAAFLSTVVGLGNAMAIDEIRVVYYPGWPCSYQVGQAKGWFEKELGMKVKFKELNSYFRFSSAFEGIHHSKRAFAYKMATAIASGDCHIAYSLGVTPFTSGVSQGAPYLLVGIAVSYPENDKCVARNGTGIRSPRDLVGKKVGVPFESVSHYKLLKALKVSGVDPGQVKIYDMTPQDIASALKWKELDCGCACEPFLSFMLEDGHLIVSAEDQEQWGMKVFDVVVAHKEFAREHPELITKFLKVVDDSTRHYHKHFEESHRLIAEVAGMAPEEARKILRKMKFLTKEEQLSPKWMGTKSKPGEVVDFVSSMAQFLVSQKAIDKILDDYRSTIDSSFCEAVR